MWIWIFSKCEENEKTDVCKNPKINHTKKYSESFPRCDVKCYHVIIRSPIHQFNSCGCCSDASKFHSIHTLLGHFHSGYPLIWSWSQHLTCAVLLLALLATLASGSKVEDDILMKLWHQHIKNSAQLHMIEAQERHRQQNRQLLKPDAAPLGDSSYHISFIYSLWLIYISNLLSFIFRVQR